MGVIQDTEDAIMQVTIGYMSDSLRSVALISMFVQVKNVLIRVCIIENRSTRLTHIEVPRT